MDRGAYDRFTADLVEKLRHDSRVIGLVALGSMAATTRLPDEWSDHDFWLITRNGEAAGLRADATWLPRSDEIVLTFAETVHGRSAIYADGHLAEYAVFDDAELEVVRANDFRVLLDRCDLAERMSSIVERTRAERAEDDATGQRRFGTLLAQLTIGVTRHGRGELLSAHHLIRGWSARTLADLLGAFVAPSPGGAPEALDGLDPNRRFERAHPALAAELDGALRAPTLECAATVLAIAQRELSGSIATATGEAFAAVRSTIDRARASTASS